MQKMLDAPDLDIELRSRGLGVGAWDREAHGYVLSR
jgi:hypothetical protein